MILALSFCVSTAFAEDEIAYVEVDLALNQYALVGNTPEVVPSVWEKGKNTDWVASAFSAYVAIEYYDALGVKLDEAPTEKGVYTAKAVVKAGYDDTKYYFGDEMIVVGTVLQTYTYQIVDREFSVSFYPEGDGDYVEEITFDDIKENTVVRYDGAVLPDSFYTIKLYNEADVQIDEIAAPGNYYVIVKMLDSFPSASVTSGQEFRCDFTLSNSVVNLVNLTGGYMYEGMYSSSAALREAYYTPTFSGLITTEDALKNSYAVSYKVNGAFVATAPIDAGEHVVRITFTQNVPSYNFKIGDFIDLKYTVYPAPYVAKFNLNVGNYDPFNAVIEQSSGVSATLSFKDLNGKLISIDKDDLTFSYYAFDPNSKTFKPMQLNAYPTDKGLYRVSVTVGVTVTGKDYFGSKFASYEISEAKENNVLDFEFQIISSMTASGIKESYVYTGEPITPVPELSSNGASIGSDYYDVAYADVNDNPVTPVERGLYYATLTFKQDFTITVNGVDKTFVRTGDIYYYYFKIVDVDVNFKATLNEDKDGFNFGFPAGVTSYNVSYYQVKNMVNYAVSKDVALNEVGSYDIVIKFTADYKAYGLYKGDVLTLPYVNSSQGTISNINMSVLGAKFSNGAYRLAYDGNVKPVTAEVDPATGLNYSILYYVVNGDGTLVQTGYPVNPAKYRAVLKVNGRNAYFNAQAGDYVTYEFIIDPVKLVGVFTSTTDNVYAKTEKTFTVKFKGNDRPVEIDESNYEIRYASIVDGVESVYTTDKPLNAGDYYAVAIFNNKAFVKYGIEYYVPAEYTRAGLNKTAVFSSLITIEKLDLAIIVGVPVEEKGLYRLSGDAVEPRFDFYKGNGVSDYSSLKGTVGLGYVSAADFEFSYKTGALNSLMCDEVAASSVKTGRYVLSLAVKDAANISIKAVVADYYGAHEGETYDASVYFASKITDEVLNVGYKVAPLPLYVDAGYHTEMYYGSVTAKTAEQLVFKTVDVTSENYDLIDVSAYGFSDFIEVMYFSRYTGSSSYDETPISNNGSTTLTSDYLFPIGDYVLKVSFGEPSPAMEEIYSYFTVFDGMNSSNASVGGNYLAEGDYYDLKFAVLSARNLRAVFVRRFDSFTADGNKKIFDVKFFSDSKDVTAEIDFSWNYCTIDDTVLGNLDENAPFNAGDYKIKIQLTSRNYKYRVMQLEGDYDDADFEKDYPYVNENSIITFNFSIVTPINLSWSWSSYDKAATSGHSYAYNGNESDIAVRFFETGRELSTVNLIYNIDYALNYYKKNSSTSFTRLSTLPVECGNYVVEIVFLRTLYDFRVGAEAKIPYAFNEADADISGEKFGRCLANDSSLYLNIYNEKRYFEFTVTRSAIEVSGVTISDKAFDNDVKASLIKKLSYAPIDNGKLVEGKTAGIDGLLKLPLRARFTSVKVGVNDVLLYALVYKRENGEEVLVKLPVTGTADANTEILTDLAALKANATSDEERAAIDSAIAAVNAYGERYELTFAPLKAKITQAVITVDPHAFTRVYNPFYNDEDVLAYDLQNGDLAASLSASPFTGSLSRDKSDDNSVGSYYITIGTFAVSGEEVNLADGTTAALNTLFKVKLGAAAYYTISKCPITVKVVSGNVKYYDEDDPQIICEVSEGTLVYGDSLKYDGECAPKRATTASRDAIGVYNIDLSPLKIVDAGGNDISYNYRINQVKATFEILPRKVTIKPKDMNVNFGDDFYTTYSVSNAENYTLQFDNNGTPVAFSFKNGDRLAGNFGLERVSASANVASRFKITSGTLRVLSETGKDVTSNYVLEMDDKPHYYTIQKISARFEVVNEINFAYYGDTTQIIPVKLITDLGSKFKVAENSSASRETGEDVDSYDILTDNSSGGIRILDAKSDQDVTSYFNIYVDKKEATFEIRKYPMTVSVKNQKIIDNGNPIIPELVYKDVYGVNVPQETLDACKVKFTYSVGNSSGKFQEGDNEVTPVPSGAVTVDSNFDIKYESGNIHVIYPQNNVIVENLDMGEDVVRKNSFVVRGLMLFETKQMYSLRTSNGENPTKDIEVELTVNEDVYNKNVYVLAARKDGKFDILTANVTDKGTIIISDNEFNYILICEQKTWPYYALAVLLVLILVGVVFALLRLKSRRSVRGKKARDFREPEPEPNEADNGGTASPVIPSGSHENDLDDVVGAMPYTTESAETEKVEEKKNKKDKKEKKDKNKDKEVKEDIGVSEDAAKKEEASLEAKPEKPEKEKKAKPEKEKKEKKKDKKDEPTPTITLGGAAPRSRSVELSSTPARPTQSFDNDELDLGETLPLTANDGDDDIVLSSSVDRADEIPTSTNSEFDDDEIVISASRRLDDDE